jgi:hypothetical protein
LSPAKPASVRFVLLRSSSNQEAAMKTQTSVFSSEEALRFGWTRTLAHAKPLLALGVVSAFLALLNRGASGPHGDWLISVLVQLAQAVVGLMWLRVLLAIHDGAPVDVTNVRQLTRGFVPYLLTTVLLGLMVGVGFALLIVPGVLLALRFGFAPLVVADHQRDPFEALRESSRLTEGARSELLGFGLLSLVINLAGLLALGLGLFVTLPTTGLAAVWVLRTLQARAATLHADSATTGAPPALAH